MSSLQPGWHPDCACCFISCVCYSNLVNWHSRVVSRGKLSARASDFGGLEVFAGKPSCCSCLEQHERLLTPCRLVTMMVACL